MSRRQLFDGLINDRVSMQLDLVREMGTTMPRGGGVPFTGELRQTQVVVGDVAWDIAHGTDPSAGALPTCPCTPPEAGGASPQTAPALASSIPCLLMLWATPQGFLKAAIANHAAVAESGDGVDVSFVIRGKYKMTGHLNARGEVDRVQTWIDQSIVGDMVVATGVKRLNLGVATIVPFHGMRTADMTEVAWQAERASAVTR